MTSSSRIAVVLAFVASALSVVAPLALGVAAPSVALARRARRLPPIFTTTHAGPLLRVVGEAPTGVQPKSVTISPDGATLAVCIFGRLNHDNVRFYDARTLRPTGSVSFPGNAVESAWSADSRTLYVSNFRRHNLHVIDVAARRLLGTVRVGRHPKVVVAAPDGHTVYVANWAGRSVSVVDTRTMTEVRRLPTGIHPRGMAVRRDGRLLVLSFEESLLHEFSPDGRELRREPICTYPRHIVLSPDESRAFVSCTLRGLSWYETDTLRRIGTAPTGQNPRTIASTRDGRWIATADFDTSTVTIVDTTGSTHRSTAPEGADRIVGLAVDPTAALRVYITSWQTDRVMALEPRQ